MTKKRKGRQPSPQEPYEIKRRLDKKEAKKIASSPPAEVPAAPTVDTPAASTTQTSPPTTTPEPETRPRPPKQDKKPTKDKGKSPITAPPRPDAATAPKYGVVVHGIALRKDVARVRRWLETGNAGLGKTVGIRWLRKKSVLLEEGKKTSLVVVYLEDNTDIDRVRLGGKWLRISPYEQDRGRK
ncbi:hypothetical protein BDZ91DRAFT_843548 [Kalaharituber pfeilii]|nr:hypothetical protein BDZ91DRAFT_843548 [Kalaharituber pfeilii]